MHRQGLRLGVGPTQVGPTLGARASRPQIVAGETPALRVLLDALTGVAKMSKSSRRPGPVPSRLVEGEHLDQPEFHQRYEGMPPGTRAELIGGVVYVPSPLRFAHGVAQVPVIVWLSYY